VKTAADKERVEISAWVTEHGDDLYRFALLRVGRRELAEDLVQETFLSALSKLGTFRGEGSVRGWLRAILRNKIIDLVRSRSFQESPMGETEFFNDWGIWKDPSSKWFEWQESPAETLERQNFFEIVRSCISKLTLKQRLVIGLRAFDGLTTEDICKELQISPSNEWVVTYRARLSLRECLEKNWYKNQ
jgi:RNA polymerase sigma-70 factor (TIGR02943 family)